MKSKQNVSLFHLEQNDTEISKVKALMLMVEEELVVVVALVLGGESQSHWLSLLQLSLSQIHTFKPPPFSILIHFFL